MKFTRRRARMLAESAERIRDLHIPRPFDLGDFLGHLAARRARPIHLQPQVTPPAGPCGLWIATAAADYIFYDEATTALHRDHIVLHEVGHMLSGHTNLLIPDPAATAQPGPEVDPGEIQAVRARSHYSDREEQEAEMIASLILRHADRVSSARRPATSQQAQVISRMDDVFGPKRR
ncbi:hypothetical protein [Streptomyces sp. NPDC003077]|uniref:hypothetical protein n=1 Tax=Streptomyces sp. NPDC003077 TaxID=3154443 RepID=UPI0033A4E76D